MQVEAAMPHGDPIPPIACRAETRHLSHIQIIPVGGIVVPNTAEIIWKEYSSKQAKGFGWCLDYDRGQA